MVVGECSFKYFLETNFLILVGVLKKTKIPSGVSRSVEANAVAQIREAAAGNQSLRVSSFTHRSSGHLKSDNSSGSSSPFSRLRKKLLYNA